MAITPNDLRAAFVAYPPGKGGMQGGVTEIVDEPVQDEIRERVKLGCRQAAVLVPIMLSGKDRPLKVLLTRRTEHLRDHAGQISFPGGGLEPGETGIAAALREANEEIGLLPSVVEIFGEMPRYVTGTGFSVAPLVGFVQTPCQLKPDAGEVDEIFEVPLDFLMDPRNVRQKTMFYRGAWRSFLTVPWAGYNIWGATAGMLFQLSRIIRKKID